MTLAVEIINADYTTQPRKYPNIKPKGYNKLMCLLEKPNFDINDTKVKDTLKLVLEDIKLELYTMNDLLIELDYMVKDNEITQSICDKIKREINNQ